MTHHLSFKMLAEKLKITVQTLRLHQSKGWLKAEKLGRKYVISSEKAEAYIRKYHQKEMTL